jgi:hypothetical protein
VETLPLVLNKDHCTIPDIQLRTMIADSNAQGKPERIA